MLDAALGALEARFTAVAPSTGSALAVRRVVAERRLMLALAKERDVVECERLLVAVEALGDDDLYSRTLIVPAFCRYCLRRGRPSLGLAWLTPLLAAVEREQAPGPARAGSKPSQRPPGPIRQTVGRLTRDCSSLADFKLCSDAS